MQKTILGFVGQIASGKGAAAEYLKKKYSANVYRFSASLTDVLNRLYLPNNRENYQKLSQILRENFGQDTLAKIIAEDVKKDTGELIIVDGVRRPADVKYLKELDGFVLVHIFADIEKRYRRITARTEKTDDQQKTFEEFKADHLKESEIQIEEISKEATEQVDNNGSLTELYQQLDELVKKYADKN